ncbi:myocardial zonula adherens protein [Ricinus communis]|uniref:myocardial zonula adherens protein n=1 Tax=Ricinus communis TaxID=3988 RepID=UPI00201AAF22|nr:myocardial zonula adherens protein [Ricinus communis]
MDLPQEIEDYIKETISDSLGLPISTQNLQLKLRASEDAHRRLRDQYLLLLEKLRQKDQLIDRAKAEASMNAMAVKKFVEENQRLAAECANLVNQCNKWEKECSLYDRDREALMDFGNEADERAKEAEFKVGELEEMLGKMYEELKLYKHEYERRGDTSSSESTDMEQDLLESILSTLVSEDEIKYGHAFLEASSANESCQKLLRMWNSLRPSTYRVLTLVAKVRALQKDKEHLRINLTKAEEEVKLLFEENNVLDAENKKLLKQHHRERNLDGSGGKHTTSASAKGNKRKSSPKMSSPIKMKFDLKDVDSMRQPLSPLRQNSPECRMHKK